MKKRLNKIVLASASPRRAEMLERMKIDFRICPVDIDETPEVAEDPYGYTLRMAEEKAYAAHWHPDEIVIAADTTVVVDGQILGKPVDEADAERMLRLLSGRSHQVLSAVAVRCQRVVSDLCSTEVSFREMCDEEIAWYISTGEPMDKAGSYGIQGFASLFIDGMNGSYSNVVGLPIQIVARLFEWQELNFLDFIDLNSDLPG